MHMNTAPRIIAAVNERLSPILFLIFANYIVHCGVSPLRVCLHMILIDAKRGRLHGPQPQELQSCRALNCLRWCMKLFHPQPNTGAYTDTDTQTDGKARYACSCGSDCNLTIFVTTIKTVYILWETLLTKQTWYRQHTTNQIRLKHRQNSRSSVQIYTRLAHKTLGGL